MDDMLVGGSTRTVRPHKSAIPLLYCDKGGESWQFWGWCGDLEEARNRFARMTSMGRRVVLGLQCIDSFSNDPVDE